MEELNKRKTFSVTLVFMPRQFYFTTKLLSDGYPLCKDSLECMYSAISTPKLSASNHWTLIYIFITRLNKTNFQEMQFEIKTF